MFQVNLESVLIYIFYRRCASMHHKCFKTHGTRIHARILFLRENRAFDDAPLDAPARLEKGYLSLALDDLTLRKHFRYLKCLYIG